MRDRDGEKRFKDRWEIKCDDYMRRREERGDRFGRHGHIWTGAFILIIGIAALIKANGTDLPDWLFSWQSFLILLGLFIGLKHNFHGGAWFILILIGGAFLVRDIYPDLPIRKYVFPAVLIILGSIIIFKPRRRYQLAPQEDEKKSPDDSQSLIAKPLVDESFDTKEDFIDSTSVFGGAKKNIISKNFKGGDLISIFGGTELDLSRADFKGTAVLELTTIFGGTKLIVPADWTVKSETVTIFGGLEDKRNMQTVIDNPEKILLLRGTVIFGGTEIKSY